MSTERHRFLFNADQFERMVETGVLGEDDRVELLRGEVITMSAIGSRHAACVNALTALLVVRVHALGIVSVQNPVRLDDINEPLPDVAVLRPKKNGYRDALPTGKDVSIVVEVADTTAVHDRGTKIPLYAKSGIKEAWLVDLNAQVVEVYTRPRDGRYTRRVEPKAGDTLVSATIPELTLAAGDILG